LFVVPVTLVHRPSATRYSAMRITCQRGKSAQPCAADRQPVLTAGSQEFARSPGVQLLDVKVCQMQMLCFWRYRPPVKYGSSM
jgi:hypothetical protein